MTDDDGFGVGLALVYSCLAAVCLLAASQSPTTSNLFEMKARVEQAAKKPILERVVKSEIERHHNGIREFVDTSSKKAMDLTGDRINDQYYLCNDGHRIVHLYDKGYWVDLGQQ